MFGGASEDLGLRSVELEMIGTHSAVNIVKTARDRDLQLWNCGWAVEPIYLRVVGILTKSKIVASDDVLKVCRIEKEQLI